MATRILKVALHYEQDVVAVRQRARQIAGLLGFLLQRLFGPPNPLLQLRLLGCVFQLQFLGDLIALLGATRDDLSVSEYAAVIEGRNPTVREGAEITTDCTLANGRVSTPGVTPRHAA